MENNNVVKKMNYLILFFIIIASCVNLNTNDITLKKSSNLTPSWVNENSQINSSNPDYINLVFMKSDLYNLSLGLKQAQTIASNKFSHLIMTAIQKQLQQRIDKLNIDNKKISSNSIALSVSHNVNKYLADFKISPPLAEQIYWEYRQRERVHDSKQYYVVWVLLLVPKTLYDKTLLAIAHELQNSKDGATVTLGNDIIQQPERR